MNGTLCQIHDKTFNCDEIEVYIYLSKYLIYVYSNLIVIITYDNDHVLKPLTRKCQKTDFIMYASKQTNYHSTNSICYCCTLHKIPVLMV